MLWAITPDGRPYNLGEVLVDSSGNYSGQMTTQLQAFGLIITAEPYFNVHQPSDVVVMENVVLNSTQDKTQPINASFQLLPRGQYTYHVPESELKPVNLNSNKKSPLELYEAQNAGRSRNMPKPINMLASNISRRKFMAASAGIPGS